MHTFKIPVYFIITTIAALQLYTSIQDSYLPYEKEVIGFIFTVISILGFFGWLRSPKDLYSGIYLSFLVITIIALLGNTLTNTSVNSIRSMTTVLTAISFLSTYFMIAASSVNLKKIANTMIAISMIAAVVSSANFNALNLRSEPPNIILIGFALALFANRTRGSLILLTVVTVSCYFSQVRIALMSILVLALLIVLKETFTRKRGRILYQTGIIFTLCLLAMFVNEFFLQSEFFTKSRFVKLSTLDMFYHDFIHRRFIEISGALTSFNDASLFIWLFGNGHSATYNGSALILALISDIHNYSWRFGDYNEVFVIHFGPVRQLFRTGILGLIIFLLPFHLSLIEKKANRHRKADFILHDTFKFSTVIGLVYWFVGPFDTNPIFAISFGVYLCLKRQTSRSENRNQKFRGIFDEGL